MTSDGMAHNITFFFSMMSSCLSLAESIAAMSPVAIQGTKVNLNYARDHSVEEGLDFAVIFSKKCKQTAVMH